MKFEQASIWRRSFSFIIDHTVLVVYAILAFFAGVTIWAVCFPGAPDVFWWIALFLYIGSIIFYVPICESLFHGKTPGKLIIGIRTVRTDGSRASGLHCFQRWLFAFFDIWMSLGIAALMSMMLSDKRQRIGDWLADCMVIVDSPQSMTDSRIKKRDADELSPSELELMASLKKNTVRSSDSPLTVADKYRSLEGSIAALRTRKGHPKLLLHCERLLADMHVRLFQRTATTFADYIKIVFKSIPNAVYESRWYILCCFAVAVAGIAIGVYSQIQDYNFLALMVSEGYVAETEANIAAGNPTAIYGNAEEFDMFWDIFTNNFAVALKAYRYGIIPIFGPIFFCLYNFVIYGSFITIFAQHGCGLAAFSLIQEHGTLELLSMIVECGAALRLGTSWLFPGRRTRLQALIRGARQSLLVLMSCIPVIFTAAVIESFVTRHHEWPVTVRFIIILGSLIFFIGYYVVLPILSKRN